MQQRKTEVAIIGGGTAGMVAYRQARRYTDQVVLIEAEQFGTTCARVGCMPSKLLIAAAEVAHSANHAQRFGIHAGPVKVDGKAVMQRVRRHRDRFVGGVLESIGKIPQQDRIMGRARFLDRHTLEIGDDEIRRIALKTFNEEFPLDPDATVHEIRETEHGVQISFDDQDGDEATETFDFLLAATGRQPNVDGLGLDKAGLELDDNGLPLYDRHTLQCGDAPIFPGLFDSLCPRVLAARLTQQQQLRHGIDSGPDYGVLIELLAETSRMGLIQTCNQEAGFRRPAAFRINTPAFFKGQALARQAGS